MHESAKTGKHKWTSWIFFLRFFCFGDNILSPDQLVWIRLSWSETKWPQFWMSPYVHCSCKLSPIYVSVRFVCTSLRDVPATYALWVHSKRILPAFRPRHVTPSTCPPWWEVTKHVLSVGGARYITVPSKWSHFIKGFPVTLLSVSWTRSCWACRRSNTVNTPSRHSLDRQFKTLTSNPI